MEVRIPYGTQEKVLRIPPEVDVDFLGPSDDVPLEDVEAAFAEAWNQPVGKPEPCVLVSSQSQVVIVVSDLTRGGGVQQMLPVCIARLHEEGVAPGSVRVLVARGAHRGMSREERTAFKETLPNGTVVEEHDCDNADRLSALLLTRGGTPVRVNSAIKNADAVFLLSPVSFHYFAGFGGGRKLVLPGCADRGAILANHRLSLADTRPATLHPRCRPGLLDGNPVHDDMCEALEALDRVIGINFFADEQGRVAFVNVGDPVRAHREACEAYLAGHERRVERYSVVVLGAGGHPYDSNLLQSHKALRHIAGAMREAGTILFYAACSEGCGSASLEAALRMDRAEFLDSARARYDLNHQTAVSLLNLTGAFEIGMVSMMNVDILLSAGIKPCVNSETFLVEALEKHGTNRIAVVHRGAGVLFRAERGARK